MTFTAPSDKMRTVFSYRHGRMYGIHCRNLVMEGKKKVLFY
jgi:hypothetical protein